MTLKAIPSINSLHPCAFALKISGPLSLRACAKPPYGTVLKIFAFARSADDSLTSAATTLPFAPRRTQPSHPLQMRHFSAVSRAIRQHKMSIQRLAPSHPPVISAGNKQILHYLHNFDTKVLTR